VLRRVGIFTLAATSLAVTVLAAPAAATPPGENGDIAFRRYLGPDRTMGAIIAIAPDGTRERQLTTPPDGHGDDVPDWAPDGSRVAFHRCADVCQILTVRPDGTELTPLSPSCPPGVLPPACTDNFDPAFSPDGKRLAFARASGEIDANGAIEHVEIWIMRADGSHPRRITMPPSRRMEDNQPQWSPDGRRIVFRRIHVASDKRAVFVVNVNGRGLRQLTPWRLNAGDGPDWSPDGSRILFRINDTSAFTESDLGTVRPNGSGLRRITHFPPSQIVLSASFSPDGRSIVVGLGGVDGQPDVFVMRADGTGIRPVTRTAAWDSAPDWGSAP
jgi:Tol biopolymer transport system component